MVCFIILHYMVDKETEKCVDSILKLNGDKKIIIVDNCSPNNSYSLLKEYYQSQEDVIVLKNKENSGFANGNNFGYEYAKKIFNNLDFIIIMNNDMEILQKNFITKIYDIYDKDKFYVLAPDVFSTSQKIHQNPEVRTIRNIEQIDKELKHIEGITKSKLSIKAFLKKIPFLTKIIKYVKNIKKKHNKDYLEKQYNKTLHGSCLIFSSLFIEKRSKAFFDKTRFYCEAQILDYQCEKENWMRLYSPEIQVLHHEDVATNATYKSYVKKSLFMNECMYNSLNEFRKLIEDNSKKVDIK